MTIAAKALPIIMSRPESVRGTLDGTKTQTRRIMKPQPGNSITEVVHGDGATWLQYEKQKHGQVGEIDCPYGAAGARLWVREPFAFGKGYDGDPEKGLQRLDAGDVPPGVNVAYIADGPLPEWAGQPRPSIFMPRWVSRIDLEVLEVRAQRIQEISAADCRAEGTPQIVSTEGCPPGKAKPLVCVSNLVGFSRERQTDTMTEDDYWRHWFAVAWEELHGRDAWKRNDWVWAITYRRVKP